jgi:hypothetical protein
MSNVMFNTITTGVVVFVSGQILVKCVLDPYISFKEHLGMVSAILLREQSKILNVNAKHEVITEIKQVSALLLSKSNAVPMYGLFAKLHLLPHYKNVRNATKNLNLIASILEEGRGAITGHAYNQVQSSLNAIGKDLGMIVTYN